MCPLARKTSSAQTEDIGDDQLPTTGQPLSRQLQNTRRRLRQNIATNVSLKKQLQKLTDEHNQLKTETQRLQVRRK
jgi:hypothetical protein